MPANPIPSQPTLGTPARAFLALLAAALVLLSILRATGSDPSLTDPRIGTTAPDFSLRRMSDGSTTTLADYDDQVFILDFWATTCPPCARSMPVMHRLEEQFADRGVRLLSINVDAPSPSRTMAVEDWVRRHEISEVLLDNGTAAWDYGASRIPLVVFVDEAGTIRRVFQGFTDYRTLAAALTEVLGG